MAVEVPAFSPSSVYHHIEIVDGGHDGLRPARYHARPNLFWLHDLRCSSYGRTAERAQRAVRLKLRRYYPLSPWFAEVPAVVHL